MKIECFDKFDIVTPEKGMVLTNGETISEQLHTPCNADLSSWREVTQEEADRIVKEHEEKMHAENPEV